VEESLLNFRVMVWIVSIPRPWVETVEREVQRRGIPFFVVQDLEDVDRVRWAVFRPRLIFVGQNLRKTSGIRALRQLRQSFPEAHLVFVVQTPSPDLERQARQAALLLFGVEPLTETVVKAILDRVFRPGFRVGQRAFR